MERQIREQIAATTMLCSDEIQHFTTTELALHIYLLIQNSNKRNLDEYLQLSDTLQQLTKDIKEVAILLPTIAIHFSNKNEA
ncbi:hypothetical protein GCM10007425_11580 [Lysinibacillus alkalisoli]|uniref:Uncharacterized protein n=1 Tax=Lysinibacillus alkalisoli TaxID=1911548 RepID=A0A917G2K4_9BACI|nr:hypothetical protein [Lysinibacillus alkalisoli]GGG18768.1 hypothetical protein GCM10007425_11580 [Lysinibacillus alkalisoli]